jgi:membrane-associated PAP2 superfamily phosphatase
MTQPPDPAFHPYTAATVLAITALLGPVFAAFPGIDLWAARLLAGPGGGFDTAVISNTLNLMRDWLSNLIVIVVIAASALVIHGVIRGRGLAGYGARDGAFVLASFALAPLLLVNILLKPGIGRPRPVHLEQFGGTDSYVPVWTQSDQCVGNCSFVSGEAAAAMALICLVVLFPRYGIMRRVVIALTVLFGFIRMIQGGHFLSDVVLAACLTYLVIWGLWWLFYVAPQRSDPMGEALRRTGRALTWRRDDRRALPPPTFDASADGQDKPTPVETRRD